MDSIYFCCGAEFNWFGSARQTQDVSTHRLRDTGAPFETARQTLDVSAHRLMDTGAPFRFMVPGTLEIMALGRPFGFFLEKNRKKKNAAIAPWRLALQRGRGSSAQLKTAADTNTYDHAKTHT